MTRVAARSPFHRSRLIRLLESWQVDAPPRPAPNLAEDLGQWLTVTDAITLAAALGPLRNPLTSNAPTPGTDDIRAEFAHLRTTLTQAIAISTERHIHQARLKCVPSPAGTPIDIAAEFSLYHRTYLAHQRDMDARIGPLRARVRAVLVLRSPTLRQLAAIDAALDKTLAARERSVLMGLPQRLEQRFRQQRAAALAGSEWGVVFCADWQRLLLAELDVRLAPVAGLIEALGNEVNKSS